MMEFRTTSALETRALGEKIGACLIAGDVVLLTGDLGAGKTTLVQGMARGLGVQSERPVRSPSFTLINTYPGRLEVFHIDLYRLEKQTELQEIGLEEFLHGQGVALVEWGERLLDDSGERSDFIDLKDVIKIHLDFSGDNDRILSISTGVSVAPEHPIFALH